MGNIWDKLDYNSDKRTMTFRDDPSITITEEQYMAIHTKWVELESTDPLTSRNVEVLYNMVYDEYGVKDPFVDFFMDEV